MKWGSCVALVILSVTGALCQNGGYSTGLGGTIGGNSQGACVFPFVYLGITYDKCTTIRNGNRPWCSLTADYKTGKRWANCQVTVNATRTKTETGNAGGSSCVFPFVYRQKTYYTCTTVRFDTKRPWCATSPNYDRDQKWAECVIYPYIRTTGGNGGALPCVFPFRFYNNWLTGCVIASQGQFPWCATTRNYNADRKWGRCIIETTSGQSGCENDYTRVDNVNTFGGRNIAGATTVPLCRSACNANAACKGFDFDANAGVTQFCYLHTNFAGTAVASGVSQYRITIRRCVGPSGSGGSSVVTTARGNSPPTRRACVFPFTMKTGKRYGSCNSVGWYTPWCATTNNYPRDREWGECNNIRTDGRN